MNREITGGMNEAGARVLMACLADEAFLAKSNWAGELSARVWKAMAALEAKQDASWLRPRCEGDPIPLSVDYVLRECDPSRAFLYEGE